MVNLHLCGKLIPALTTVFDMAAFTADIAHTLCV